MAMTKESTSTANVPAKMASVTVLSGTKTEKDLDAAVTRVQVLKAKAAESAWELGVEIKNIYDAQLWKLRDEGGKPRYKNPDAFTNEELGMTPANAWKLMDIAKNFTRGQVHEFGTAKLGLILQAPESARAELLSKAKGASKTEVEKEVRRANKERKTVKSRKGVERPKPAAKVGKATITIANVLGSQTVPLWTKASVSAATGDRKSWVKAKKVADVPSASIELENGVVQHFTLTADAEGCLKLRIETRRSSAD
jgi:hypothetical protein